MTLSRPFGFFAILIFALTACQHQSTPATIALSSATAPEHTPTPELLAIVTPLAPSAAPGISVEARTYLDHALDIMEQHALYRQEIKWKPEKPRLLICWQRPNPR